MLDGFWDKDMVVVHHYYLLWWSGWPSTSMCPKTRMLFWPHPETPKTNPGRSNPSCSIQCVQVPGMLLWPHPETPKPKSLPLLHLCASDLCISDVVCVQVMWLFCVCVCKWCACRLLKGSPLRWHLQGIFLDLCGPLIICATEVPYPNP